MIQGLRIFLLGLLMSLGVLALPTQLLAAGPTTPTQTQSSGVFNQACQGNAAQSPLCSDVNNPNTGKDNPIGGPNGIAQRAADLIAVIAGVAAIIIIIVGGISYATAGGNAEQAKSARLRVINAIIGLAVIVLAWAIVSFVIQKIIK